MWQKVHVELLLCHSENTSGEKLKFLKESGGLGRIFTASSQVVTEDTNFLSNNVSPLSHVRERDGTSPVVLKANENSNEQFHSLHLKTAVNVHLPL